MRPHALLLTLLVLASACCPSPAARRDPVEIRPTAGPDLSKASEDEKTLYIIGIAVGRSATTLDLSADELRFVQAGMEDQILGRPARLPVEVYAPKVEELAKRRAAATVDKREAEGKAALAAAEREPGAAKTESGLVFRILKPGSGASPTTADKVKVRYRGTFPNGTEFDSSTGTEPVEFGLTGIIPCWVEALPRMKVGEKAKLVCPPALAYGAEGNPPAMPGHATLIFEIELVGIEPAGDKAKTVSPVPGDPKAP